MKKKTYIFTENDIRDAMQEAMRIIRAAKEKKKMRNAILKKEKGISD